MALEFRKMKREEIRQAADLAARAFEDYEYFTLWFPDKAERKRVQFSLIWHEYRTNFRRADYLIALKDGVMVAVAQLNPPSYRKPSDLNYLLHGWLAVYKTGDRNRIDEWLAMDAAAGQPCHDYQKTGADIWYASSLTVHPDVQGSGIGTEFISFWEKYVREHGGRELVFFTNSEENLQFYLKRGYEIFHQQTIEYRGEKMGSWSLRKTIVLP